MKRSQPDTLRDSGVPAIGSIPSHWTVSPLKHVIKSLEQGWSPECENRPAVEGEWAVLKVGCVNGGQFDPDENKALPAHHDGIPSLTLCKGDVLVSRANTRDLVGSCAVVPVDYPRMMLCDKLYRLRTSSACVPDYLAFLITALGRVRIEAEASGASSSMLNISQSVIRDLPLPLPPVIEQRRIVSVLRGRLKRIDALMAKQERLIESLAEKRKAIVTHAVTNGLCKTDTRTHRAASWLGPIPAHWSLKPLKRLSPQLVVGIVVEPTQYISDEGKPFIYGGDIREGVISWATSRRISDAASRAMSKTTLRAGDLLMVRVGAPGVTAIVPQECEGGNCASVMLIRRGDFDSRWLCYTLNSRVVRSQVEVVQYGAAQEQFNISHALTFMIPTPPRQEQADIASFLDEQVGALERLVAKAHQSIELMREHRAALITAAVTGKIDVRDSAEDVE